MFTDNHGNHPGRTPEISLKYEHDIVKIIKQTNDKLRIMQCEK